jgi:hypothetical protein
MNPIIPGQPGLPRVVNHGMSAALEPAAGGRGVGAAQRADTVSASDQTRAEPRIRRLSAAGMAQVDALLTYSSNASPRSGGSCGHQVDLYA